MINAIASAAGWFIGIFGQGAATLWGFISGVIPFLLVMLTFMNALVIFIGEDRVKKIGEFLSKSPLLRYTLLPVVMLTLLTGSGALPVVSKMIPEKSKPGFADVFLTYLHPSAGLFPHVHASEVWVYMGLANGITQAGYSGSEFAVRAILTCIPIMLVRGIVTEKITEILLNRRRKAEATANLENLAASSAGSAVS